MNINYRAKISDFGLSKLKVGGNNNNKLHYYWNYWNLSMDGSRIMKEEKHTNKSDIYSLGIILWEILHKQTPFDGLKTAEIITTISTGNRREELSYKI
jgi:serine/threonine protein kinase